MIGCKPRRWLGLSKAPPLFSQRMAAWQGLAAVTASFEGFRP
jgi:hypothetical protein